MLVGWVAVPFSPGLCSGLKAGPRNEGHRIAKRSEKRAQPSKSIDVMRLANSDGARWSAHRMARSREIHSPGNMRNFFKLVLIAALPGMAGISTVAAETAVLRNGFTIHCERREARGELTRLFLSDIPDSFVDIPTSEIVSFEEDGKPTAPAAKPVQPRANKVHAIDEAISASSSRNNVSPDLIKSVIRAESGFNPQAVSRKGAQGLMQLMPQTAARFGVQNPFDPADNVEAGTRYLRELLGLYNNDVVKAVAAYNAGPERVSMYHGVPPYPETISYVSRVIHNFSRPGNTEINSRVNESDFSIKRHPLTMSREQSNHTAPKARAEFPPVGGK